MARSEFEVVAVGRDDGASDLFDRLNKKAHETSRAVGQLNQGASAGATATASRLENALGNLTGRRFAASMRSPIQGFAQDYDRLASRINVITGSVTALTNTMGLGLNVAQFIFRMSVAGVSLVSNKVISLNREVARSTETVRNLEATFTGFFRNRELTQDIVGTFRKLSTEMPLSIQNIGEIMKAVSVVPGLRNMLQETGQLEGNVRRIVGIIQGLLTLRPSLGLDSAVFAFREALTGNFISLMRRFEVSPDLIAGVVGKTREQLRNTGAPGIVNALEAFLKVNVGDDTVERINQQFSKRVKILENLMEGVRIDIGNAGFYENLVQELNKVIDALSRDVKTEGFQSGVQALSNEMSGLLVVAREFGTEINAAFSEAFGVSSGPVGVIQAIGAGVKFLREEINELFDSLRANRSEAVEFFQDIQKVVSSLAKHMGELIPAVVKLSAHLASGAASVAPTIAEHPLLSAAGGIFASSAVAAAGFGVVGMAGNRLSAAFKARQERQAAADAAARVAGLTRPDVPTTLPATVLSQAVGAAGPATDVEAIGLMRGGVASQRDAMSRTPRGEMNPIWRQYETGLKTLGRNVEKAAKSSESVVMAVENRAKVSNRIADLEASREALRTRHFERERAIEGIRAARAERSRVISEVGPEAVRVSQRVESSQQKLSEFRRSSQVLKENLAATNAVVVSDQKLASLKAKTVTAFEEYSKKTQLIQGRELAIASRADQGVAQARQRKDVTERRLANIEAERGRLVENTARREQLTARRDEVRARRSSIVAESTPEVKLLEEQAEHARSKASVLKQDLEVARERLRFDTESGRLERARAGVSDRTNSLIGRLADKLQVQKERLGVAPESSAVVTPRSLLETSGGATLETIQNLPSGQRRALLGGTGRRSESEGILNVEIQVARDKVLSSVYEDAAAILKEQAALRKNVTAPDSAKIRNMLEKGSDELSRMAKEMAETSGQQITADTTRVLMDQLKAANKILAEAASQPGGERLKSISIFTKDLSGIKADRPLRSTVDSLLSSARGLKGGTEAQAGRQELAKTLRAGQEELKTLNMAQLDAQKKQVALLRGSKQKQLAELNAESSLIQRELDAIGSESRLQSVDQRLALARQGVSQARTNLEKAESKRTESLARSSGEAPDRAFAGDQLIAAENALDKALRSRGKARVQALKVAAEEIELAKLADPTAGRILDPLLAQVTTAGTATNRAAQERTLKEQLRRNKAEEDRLVKDIDAGEARLSGLLREDKERQIRGLDSQIAQLQRAQRDSRVEEARARVDARLENLRKVQTEADARLEKALAERSARFEKIGLRPLSTDKSGASVGDPKQLATSPKGLLERGAELGKSGLTSAGGILLDTIPVATAFAAVQAASNTQVVKTAAAGAGTLLAGAAGSVTTGLTSFVPPVALGVAATAAATLLLGFVSEKMTEALGDDTPTFVRGGSDLFKDSGVSGAIDFVTKLRDKRDDFWLSLLDKLALSGFIDSSKEFRQEALTRRGAKNSEKRTELLQQSVEVPAAELGEGSRRKVNIEKLFEQSNQLIERINKLESAGALTVVAAEEQRSLVKGIPSRTGARNRKILLENQSATGAGIESDRLGFVKDSMEESLAQGSNALLVQSNLVDTLAEDFKNSRQPMVEYAEALKGLTAGFGRGSQAIPEFQKAVEALLKTPLHTARKQEKGARTELETQLKSSAEELERTLVKLGKTLPAESFVPDPALVAKEKELKEVRVGVSHPDIVRQKELIESPDRFEDASKAQSESLKQLAESTTNASLVQLALNTADGKALLDIYQKIEDLSRKKFDSFVETREVADDYNKTKSRLNDPENLGKTNQLSQRLAELATDREEIDTEINDLRAKGDTIRDRVEEMATKGVAVIKKTESAIVLIDGAFRNLNRSIANFGGFMGVMAAFLPAPPSVVPETSERTNALSKPNLAPPLVPPAPNSGRRLSRSAQKDRDLRDQDNRERAELLKNGKKPSSGGGGPSEIESLIQGFAPPTQKIKEDIQKLIAASGDLYKKLGADKEEVLALANEKLFSAEKSYLQEIVKAHGLSIDKRKEAMRQLTDFNIQEAMREVETTRLAIPFLLEGIKRLKATEGAPTGLIATAQRDAINKMVDVDAPPDQIASTMRDLFGTEEKIRQNEVAVNLQLLQGNLILEKRIDILRALADDSRNSAQIQVQANRQLLKDQQTLAIKQSEVARALISDESLPISSRRQLASEEVSRITSGLLEAAGAADAFGASMQAALLNLETGKELSAELAQNLVVRSRDSLASGLKDFFTHTMNPPNRTEIKALDQDIAVQQTYLTTLDQVIIAEARRGGITSETLSKQLDAQRKIVDLERERKELQEEQIRLADVFKNLLRTIADTILETIVKSLANDVIGGLFGGLGGGGGNESNSFGGSIINSVVGAAVGGSSGGLFGQQPETMSQATLGPDPTTNQVFQSASQAQASQAQEARRESAETRRAISNQEGIKVVHLSPETLESIRKGAPNIKIVNSMDPKGMRHLVNGSLDETVVSNMILQNLERNKGVRRAIQDVAGGG